jgi:Aspartyl protease
VIEPAHFPFVDADLSQPGASLMPLLPLTLSRGIQEIEVSGLLDTGASVNVLPYSLGLQLGLVWEEQRTSISLSGNLARLPARGVIVSAKIASFAPVRLAFAWTQTDNIRLLLGQANFFLEFDVCFFRSRSEFEIKPKGVA